MKKFLSLILIVAIIISSTACGREGNKLHNNSNKKVKTTDKEVIKDDKETPKSEEVAKADTNDKTKEAGENGKASEGVSTDKTDEQANKQTNEQPKGQDAKDSTGKSPTTSATSITTSKDSKETKTATGTTVNSNQTSKPATSTQITKPDKKVSEDPIMVLGKLEFSMQDIEGINYNSSDIFKENKLTMINIWGTLCAPCIKELPELQALSEEFSSKGIGIIGIVGDVSGEDGLEDAKTIIGKKKIEYINLIPSSKINEILISKINGYPVTIFVDGEGNLVGEPIVGARSKEEYKEIAEKVFGEI